MKYSERLEKLRRRMYRVKNGSIDEPQGQKGLSSNAIIKFVKKAKEEFIKDTDYYVEVAKRIEQINNALYGETDNALYIISEMLSEEKMDKNVLNELAKRHSLLRYAHHYKLPLNILYIIKRYFKNIDKNTIYYTFLQRYAQHKYSNFLKLGNKREINFDCTYALLDGTHNELDPIQDTANHVLHAFYYKPYKLTNQKGRLVETIPYYTPNRAMFDQFDGDIKTIQNTVPLVTDNYAAGGEGLSKIEFVAEHLSLEEIAKQLSDLVSFAVHAFRKTNTSYWNTVTTLTEKLSTDFANAIREDRLKDQKELLREFGNQVLTIMSDFVTIPYFYYPYIIYLKIESNNDEENAKKLRDFYKNFVCATVSELQTHINFPSWKL